MATTATSPQQQPQTSEYYPAQQPQGQTPTSLYVGDLEPSVTEAILFEVFNSVGTVASIRVCRDAVTRRSLGYGYVNYLDVQHAERAIETLNYAQIRNQPIRIMWSNRDPATRKSGTGNIFIKNLDPSIDHKSLHDTFAAFGNILSCKVAMDHENKSKGYGFVHYETLEQAQVAIESVNGMLVNDRQVFVGLHVSKKERDSKLEEQRAQFTNIYVKNVDASIDDEKFLELFSAFGTVSSCRLARAEDGSSKEFGFVNYENHEDAAKAVAEMNEKEIEGKALYVGRAQKKSEREEDLRRQYEKIREEKMSKYQGVNLYVKNLDDAIDEEKLRQEFSVFGAITSCKIMVDEKTGASKGFGFVCFSNPDEATKAVTEMNGRILNQKPLYVALAQRKEARRAQLSAQIQQRNFRMQQSMIPGVPQAYPGQPMFYPAPPQQRGFFPGQPQPGMMGQFPGQPGMPGRPFQQAPQGYPPQQRGPRQNRPPTNRGNQPMIPGGAPAGRKPGFKYANNVRNAPPAPATSGLDLASLAAMSPESQKQLMGETLFPLVQAEAPAVAGKVTGMLLEMETEVLLNLLEDSAALTAKIGEAVEALEMFAAEAAAQEQE